ncbi:hypothetical protein KI387_013912, partial [Taxus chinensis]
FLREKPCPVPSGLWKQTKPKQGQSTGIAENSYPPWASVTPASAEVVVGISLQEEESKELLSWAMSVAACPGDTVVALHVLVEKHGRESHFVKARIDNAKAMLINLLGSFMDLWQAKHIKVEAKVMVHSSLERALVNEAATLGASFLVLGASTYRFPCPSIRVTKYCLEHSPAGCAVIAVKDRRDVPLKEFFFFLGFQILIVMRYFKM